MSKTGLGNLDDLFKAAGNDGLTQDTLGLVVSNLNGPTMTQAVGLGLDELESNDITLAMNIIDMSGSMTPHAQDLMRAYNEDYLEAMRHSPAADDILVSTIVFDNKVELLHGYVSLDDATPLTNAVYAPRGSTALYDAVAGGLTNMVLYSQQLRQSGVSVRCVVIIYSDGEDNASKQRAKDVKKTVDELLRQELYTFAYVGFIAKNQRPMGFNTGQPSPVEKMAAEIGFTEALTAGLSAAELRRIFYMASQSTIMVSRGSAVSNSLFA